MDINILWRFATRKIFAIITGALWLTSYSPVSWGFERPLRDDNPNNSPIIIDLGRDEIDLGDAGTGVSFDLFGNGSSIYLQ